MTAVLTLAENAVITKLTPLMKTALGGASGGYLEAVESYQGSLDPDDNDEDLNRVVGGRTPALLVTMGDGEYDEVTVNRRTMDQNTTVEILAVSTNLRSPEAKAKGDSVSTDLGIYQIIEDVRDKLFGVELGVDGVGVCIPSGYQAVSRSGDKAIWRMTFNLALDAIGIWAEDSADDYESIRHKTNEPDDEEANPIVTGDIDLT